MWSLLLLFGKLQPGAITAATSLSLAASGTLTAPVGLQAAPAELSISASATISPAPTYVLGAATVRVGSSSAILSSAPVAFYGASGLTLSASGTINLTARFSSAAGIRFGATGDFVPPTMLTAAGFRIGTRATITPGPRETQAGITIDGIDVKARVRMQGLTIRDILNDAPNTCALVIEGDGPAVGQSIRITLNEGSRVLFSGQIQTVDQAFESLPTHVAWYVTAIDDTAAANYRRPFGTYVDVSASLIALELRQKFAPGFSVAGIAPGLPPVSIVFDGADTLIGCLARLATAIGGYCKIEDGTIFLFLEDLEATPDPIDPTHRFLMTPAIQANVDSSQLRTRVYGKGYGESVTADLAAGESLFPIQDGAQFPPLGGLAIAGTTPAGAQSERVAYTGVELQGGGTLVGPGAGPTVAPALALAPGAGVTNGRHDVAVVFVTATGKSLPGPFASIDVPTQPPPGTAPVAAAAQNGTGPDQGSHDYVVSFVTAFGETTPSPVSNAVATSAAAGQIGPPGSGPYCTIDSGAGVPDGVHDYCATFVTAQGETQAGPGGWQYVTAGPQLVGQITQPANGPTLAAAAGAGVEAGRRYYRVTFGDNSGDTAITNSQEASLDVGNGPQLPQPGGYWGTPVAKPGGSLTVGQDYAWRVTFGDSVGETTPSTYASNNNQYFRLPAGNGSVELSQIPIGPAGTLKRFLYRSTASGPQDHLVATINDNTTTVYTDALADAAVGRLHPGGNTTGEPFHVVNLTNIPIGPAGTTNRKVWRHDPGTGTFRYVNTVAGNLTTTLTDTTPTASLGASAPQTNTTGTMQPYNRIQVTNIPIGPGGTTGRRLYRRLNQFGSYSLVVAIADNSTTGYTDTKNALGVEAPTSNTTGTAVQKIPVANIPIGPASITARKLYRRFNGSGSFLLVTTIANNTTTTFTDAVPNSGLGAAALATPTAVGNQIAVTVPLGASAVTSRELYMSPVGTPTRRLALVIGNNTATTATITASDATLGAAALEPIADTSGLQQPNGQVNPGATVLPVAAAATFLPGGGWVILAGGQVVRYHGISGQTLTGIPATGSGSITTTVLYGSQALPSPMLVGVTGLGVAMLKGSAVHIWVQRDDLAAQAEQAARTGGAGIVEYLLVDTRRGLESLTARCDADLALFSRPIVTVSYATRDLKTKSGKTIVVALESPRIHETLTIQEATITEIDLVTGLAPRFTVKASSVRFSLEDTLRRMIAGGQIVGGSS